MANEDAGDARTLDLLRQFRALCSEEANHQDELAGRFHELLAQVAHPSLPGLDQDLSFRVVSYTAGSNEMVRTIAACGNVKVARAAFEVAVQLYPGDRWTLTHGGLVIADSWPRPLDQGGRQSFT